MSLYGKDKRSHRTTDEMIRCLLSIAGLPTKFCALLYKWINLYKEKIAPNLIPKLLLKSGSKECLTKFLHVLGATVYVNSDSDKALEARSEQNVFSRIWPVNCACIQLIKQSQRNSHIPPCQRFDDTTFLLPNSMSQKLIDKFKNPIMTIPPAPYISYAETMSTFDPTNCLSYTVTIPISGYLGLTWTGNNNFGIALIIKMDHDSPSIKRM